MMAKSSFGGSVGIAIFITCRLLELQVWATAVQRPPFLDPISLMRFSLFTPRGGEIIASSSGSSDLYGRRTKLFDVLGGLPPGRRRAWRSCHQPRSLE